MSSYRRTLMMYDTIESGRPGVELFLVVELSCPIREDGDFHVGQNRLIWTYERIINCIVCFEEHKIAMIINGHSIFAVVVRASLV